MKKGVLNKFIYTLAASVLISGCSALNPVQEPNITKGYSSISDKANKLLETPPKRANVEIITEEKLPIYEKEFNLTPLGGENVLSYSARNIDAKTLKSTLEEQLGKEVKKISVVPEINQILINLGRSSQKTTNTLERAVSQEEIMGLIREVDKDPPQMGMDLRVVKIFGDYTKDISSFLSLNPKKGEKGLLPGLLMDLPGAELRVPERAAEKGLGVQYALLGEMGRYMLNLKLDQLESHGFAEDLAVTSLVVSNGKKAKINLTQELPYQDEVPLQGGILALTKYKPIENSLEITPSARDDGNIYLDKITAKIGSYNPTGVLQLPGIVLRGVEIEGVEMKQGETIVIGGFRIDHTLGIKRQDPWLSHIPGLGFLFRAKDEEKSTNQVLFMATPYYIDINKN